VAGKPAMQVEEVETLWVILVVNLVFKIKIPLVSGIFLVRDIGFLVFRPKYFE